MALVIDIRAEDLGKFEKKLAQEFRPTVDRALREIGKAAVRELKVETSRKAIRDLGGFATGWMAVRVGWGRTVVVNRAPYAMYVEGGRRPGRPPPVRAIESWSRRRGLSPYAVARSIGRRGIRARRVMTGLRFGQWVKAHPRRIFERELERALRKAAR